MSMPVLGGHSHNYAKLEENLHSIMGQLVDGVSFIHRYGIAHLDLKPHNILVDGHGPLWIINFGVSEQVKSIDDLHQGFWGLLATQLLRLVRSITVQYGQTYGPVET